MRFSNLAIIGAGTLGVSAVSAFGSRLGRDTYNNFQSIIGYIALIVIGLGAFILPYKSIKTIVSVYPGSTASYIGKLLLPWMICLAIGVCLNYPYGFLAWVFTPGNDQQLFKSQEAQWVILRYTVALAALSGALGLLSGLANRGRQKAAIKAAMFNEDFLAMHGIREIASNRFTHVDGTGTKLRLMSQSPTFIGFETDKGTEAVITIDGTGRFQSYVKEPGLA